MEYTLWIEASVVAAVMMILFHVVRSAFIFDNVYIQVVLTGFLGHLLMEATQLNSYYCKNGHACKK